MPQVNTFQPPSRDRAFIESLLPAVERLLVPWHRATVGGFEHWPDEPVLVVGNHSGGSYTGDTWIFAAALFRARGFDALPFGLAHDLALKLPLVRDFLRRVGCVAADPTVCVELLRAGHNVMVYPGGDHEALRPYRERNRVKFGGRRGYIRTALRAGVPIMPLASHGAHGTFIVLDDLPRLGRALGAERFLRMKAFPLALSVPWGLTLGPTLPYLPLPCRMSLQILPPIRFERTGTEAALDEAYVLACAQLVEARLQEAMDARTKT